MTSAPATTERRDVSPAPGEWRRFWRTLFFAVALPLLILFAALEWLGWRTGESWTPSQVARAWERTPSLVWANVKVESYVRYKLARLAVVRPDVLIMGTSRAVDFRSAMFRPYGCYNLSRVSWPVDTYAPILQNLPAGYKPKVIIFTLDFTLFSGDYAKRFSEYAPVFGPETVHEHFVHLHNLVTQAVQHPSVLWTRRTFGYDGPALGLFAIEGGNGFRADGSEQIPWGMLSVAGVDPRPETRTRWKELLAGGAVMEPHEQAELQKFASLAHEKGIPLIGVQMPVYGPAARIIETDPQYGLLKDFRTRAAQGYFRQMGIEFFDFMDYPGYGEDYRYFNDAMHPGEQLTASILAAMLSDPGFHALLPQLDATALEKKVAADNGPGRHVFFYGNEF